MRGNSGSKLSPDRIWLSRLERAGADPFRRIRSLTIFRGQTFRRPHNSCLRRSPQSTSKGPRTGETFFQERPRIFVIHLTMFVVASRVYITGAVNASVIQLTYPYRIGLLKLCLAGLSEGQPALERLISSPGIKSSRSREDYWRSGAGIFPLSIPYSIFSFRITLCLHSPLFRALRWRQPTNSTWPPTF